VIQANLRDMFKKASKRASTPNIVSPHPLSSTPSTPSVMKLQKTQKMTLNQQMKDISIWITTLISCAAQA